MTITPPLTPPSERLLPRWPAAVLAYRATRQAGHDHHAAHDAAVAALRELLPDVPEKDAVQETINAVAYAAREHTA